MPTTNDIYLQRFDGVKWAEKLGIITVDSSDMVIVTNHVSISSGKAYKYNNVIVIQAQTASSNFFFANGGNLTGSGSNDLALGSAALQGVTTGSDNIAVGTNALYVNTSGSRNVSIGTDAAYFTSTQSDGTFVGYRAGYGVTGNSHTNNVFIGSSAGRGVTTGGYNTFLGSQAGYAFTTGDNNTAVGFYALYGTVTTAMGSSNTVVGAYCLYRGCSSGENVAIGTNIGDNSVSAFSGYRNVFIGTYCARAVTSASLNVIVGGYAARALTTGSYNLAMGYLSFDTATTASYNVAIGAFCLTSVTTGDSNIGIGVGQGGAGAAISSGSNNIAIGSTSMAGGAAAITGGSNVCIGVFSGYYLQGTANSNTFLGSNSGGSVTTGARNVILGQTASYSAGITTGSDNVIIGTAVWSGGANSSDILAIGNYGYGAMIYGDFSTSRMTIGNAVSSVVATLGLFIKSSSYIGLVIKGAASQSANLQEWRNSSGTVLAAISSAGTIILSAGGTIADSGNNTILTAPYTGFGLYSPQVGGYVLTTDNVSVNCHLDLTLDATQYLGWAGLGAGLSVVSNNLILNSYSGYVFATTGGSTATVATIDNAGALTIGDISVAGGTISATTSTLGLFGVSAVAQPTTGITAASFATNTSLIFDDSATWGGYTIGQVVAAMRAVGLLA